MAGEQLKNRSEAGQRLAELLRSYAKRSDVIVLGLPRGGIPVAYEIAKALRAELDVFFVRKIGVPHYPELAMGAIASGGVQMVNPDMVEEFSLSEEQVAAAVAIGERELARQELAFRKDQAPLALQNRTVILVDDGIATGYTMRTAVEAAKRLGAAHVLVATGVAPLSTFLLIKPEVDEIVCLMTPAEFHAVGLHYRDFSQVSDDEVKRLLGLGREALLSETR